MGNETGKVVGKPTPKNEEAVPAQAALPSGPTPGEIEERQVNLENENLELKASIARLEEMVKTLAGGRPIPGGVQAPAASRDGATPVFDPDEPHGIVVGDSNVAYVQNGHQFGRDRQYLETEPNRGSPKPFRPQLVGVVKPPRLAPAA